MFSEPREGLVVRDAVKRVAVLLLVPLLLVVTAAQAAPHAPRVADRHGYADLAQRWSGYWNAKNLDATMGLYAPDAVFLPAQGKAWHGKAEIRRQCAALLKVYDPHVELTSEHVESSGALAYDTGIYQETINPAKGGKSIHAEGGYLFIFKRGRDGRWRIVEQSWTSLAPVKL